MISRQLGLGTLVDARQVERDAVPLAELEDPVLGWCAVMRAAGDGAYLLSHATADDDGEGYAMETSTFTDGPVVINAKGIGVAAGSLPAGATVVSIEAAEGVRSAGSDQVWLVALHARRATRITVRFGGTVEAIDLDTSGGRLRVGPG